ncbi:MAG TPA: hypothetical protein VM425_16200 [Myxococcota bacterium]|nr:hypothetical protein [Myxococcota bacterium]
MTFKERFRDLQELVRELVLIREHNLQFKEDDSQKTLLLFAEASLCLIVLERFLRILPSVKATERDTLFNLLGRATSSKVGVLHFVDLNSGRPVLDEQRRQRIIHEIKDVRNTLQHGNYEQAARQSGCSTTVEYFNKFFASEIEELYKITDSLMKQIDADTGEPWQQSK